MNSTVSSKHLTNHDDRIRLFFGGHTMAPGVLSPPELADSFRSLIQSSRSASNHKGNGGDFRMSISSLCLGNIRF